MGTEFHHNRLLFCVSKRSSSITDGLQWCRVFLIRRSVLRMRGGGSALWCQQNSHQEHTPDQWTHTDPKCSEERRQQTLKWGRRLIDDEYERLHLRLQSVLVPSERRGEFRRTVFPGGERTAGNSSNQPFRCHPVSLGLPQHASS